MNVNAFAEDKSICTLCCKGEGDHTSRHFHRKTTHMPGDERTVVEGIHTCACTPVWCRRRAQVKGGHQSTAYAASCRFVKCDEIASISILRPQRKNVPNGLSTCLLSQLCSQRRDTLFTGLHPKRRIDHPATRASNASNEEMKDAASAGAPGKRGLTKTRPIKEADEPLSCDSLQVRDPRLQITPKNRRLRRP